MKSFIFLILLILVISCDNPNNTKVTCITIDECKDDEICKDGFCKVPEEIKPDCQAKEDCQLGYYCNTNFHCVKDICTSDDYCGTGKICENEECIEGCRKKEDCDGGEICNAQLHCEAKPDCRDNPDICEQGYKCNIGSGECEINNSCVTITDCPDNYECIGSECVEKERCSETNPCTVAGEICKASGFCGPDTGCEDDAYCIAKDETKPSCNTASGICYECNKDEDCTVEGEGCFLRDHVCGAGNFGECQNDSDCGLNRSCDLTVSPHECKSAFGDDCTCSRFEDEDNNDLTPKTCVESDCTNGEKCLTGNGADRCVECLQDNDCPPITEGETTTPRVCNPNTNLCESEGSGSSCQGDEDCNVLGGEECVDGVCTNPNSSGNDGIADMCESTGGLLFCLLFGGSCSGTLGIGGDCILE